MVIVVLPEDEPHPFSNPARAAWLMASKTPTRPDPFAFSEYPMRDFLFFQVRATNRACRVRPVLGLLAVSLAAACAPDGSGKAPSQGDSGELEDDPLTPPSGDTGDSGERDDTGAPIDDLCGEAQEVMDLHCVGCHGITPTDGLDLRDLSASVGQSSRHAAVSVPLIAPGDAMGSYLLHKIDGTHADVGGPGVQMPPGVSLDPADTALLTEWINAGAVCADPVESAPADYDPNTLDQAALFVCDGSPSSSPGRLRRIDKHHLHKRVGLSGRHILAANPLEAPSAARYSTYAEGATLDVATLDLYLDMLPYVGEPWSGTRTWEREALSSKDDALGCFYGDESPDTACVETFVQTYLETAVVLGIPDPDEVERLTDFALATLAAEADTGSDRNESVTLITSAAWLHASALFESEVGALATDAHGRRRLTDSELGAMVAGMLTDRGPGASSIYLYDNGLSGDERNTDGGAPHMADVAAAVLDGSIQQPAVIAGIFATHAAGIDEHREDEWIEYGTHSLAQRLHRGEYFMADRIDRFFLEWLDVERFASGFQDAPNATTRWHDDSGLYYQRALDEMRSYEGWNQPTGLMVFTDTLARVVHEDQDVLGTLLTTNRWFLPETEVSENDYSNRLYGLEDPVGSTRAEKWIDFPTTERAGLLTHPVWLAAHGDAFEDGPSLIHRGKWIREQLFCETVPPLELVTVAAMLPESDGSLSARQRVEQTIETQAECMGCHQSMNDLGKPFELYNHAGGVRVDDHGAAPDGSTVVTNAPDPALNQSYATPMDFVTALSESQHVKRCFIRQTFRYFAGRDETAADACVLTDMEAAYDDSGGSFVSMLATLAAHDALVLRTDGDTP